MSNLPVSKSFLLGFIAWIPQIREVWVNKRHEGISLATFSVVTIALGYVNSVQGTKKQKLYYSLITAGPVSAGGTGFVAGETIEGLTTGVTADLIDSNSSNRGQNGRSLVVAGLTTAVIENGSVQFVTGSGNGGHNNNTVTGASYEFLRESKGLFNS